jgi:multiple antibiotic resistance protein
MILNQFFHQFSLTFVPLFVAINALGVVPLFLSMTEGLNHKSRSKLARDAAFTALVVSSIFVFAGKPLFKTMGITDDDFRIGGGIVLLLIAIMDLLFSGQDQRRAPVKDVSVVPIGVPLIIGPGAMTTLIILVDRFGYFMTFVSLITNLLLTWILFSQATWVVRIIGKSGTRVFTKVFSLILAAIAVMMIRVGITGTLSQF